MKRFIIVTFCLWTCFAQAQTQPNEERVAQLILTNHFTFLLSQIVRQAEQTGTWEEYLNAAWTTTSAVELPIANKICSYTLYQAAWLRYLFEWVHNGDNGEVTCSTDGEFQFALYPNYNDLMKQAADNNPDPSFFGRLQTANVADLEANCVQPAVHLMGGYDSVTHWKVPASVITRGLPTGLEAQPCTPEKAARLTLYLKDAPVELTEIFHPEKVLSSAAKP